MTLADLVFELGELGVRSQRLESDYVRFINRAHQMIQSRNNWSFMHSRIQVTINGGENSGVIQSNFKELSPEKSPVTYADNSGRPVPCLVSSRAVIERTGDFVSFQPARLMQPVQIVFLETDGATKTLNLAPRFLAPKDITFTLDCFLFLPALTLGNQSDFITNSPMLGDALLNKAKAIAYFAEDPGDQRGFACEKQYQEYYRSALYADQRSKIAGRAVHF